MHKSEIQYSFIDQKQAEEIDSILMGEDYGYSTQQLMELAGLSVAAVIQKLLYEKWHKITKILVISGPGSTIP